MKKIKNLIALLLSVTLFFTGNITTLAAEINPTPTEFEIICMDTDFGQVSTDLMYAPEGTLVTITVTPDSSYQLNMLKVFDETNNDCSINKVNSEIYNFTMPAKNVWISADFIPVSEEPEEVPVPETSESETIESENTEPKEETEISEEAATQENIEPENQEEIPTQRGVSLPVSMAVNDTRKTFLEILGLSGFESDYIAFIKKYASEDESTGFYMGTPYTNTVGMNGSDLTESGFQNVGWDIYSPRGDNMQNINLRLPKQYQGGMNCTGFVWHLFHKFGIEHGKNIDNQIPRLGGNTPGPAPFNGTWEGYVDVLSNQVKIYSFNGKMTTLPSGKVTNWEDGKQQMLQSGILEYGDIIYAYRNTTEPGTDGHVGIYVGDGKSDLFWHSMYAKTLNTVSGMPYPVGSKQNNGITEIVPKTDNVTWYVIKTGGVSNAMLKIKKSSAAPSITNNNGCYSLKGAEYGVYRDPECTDLIGTLVTQDEEGNSGTLEITPGQYYVKEIKSPEGYLKNEKVYPVNASVGGKTYTVECEDIPGNDPAAIELTKIDAEGAMQGMASLAGAQFTVKYYDGYYTKEKLPEKATRTWVIETKEITNSSGKKVYMTRLDEKYKVSGDELFKMGGIPTLPLGTISIEETKAPDGYLLEGGYLKPEGSDDKIEGVYVSQIVKKGDLVKLNGGNKYSVSDKVVKGGVAIEKWDAELGEAAAQGAGTLKGAEFTIISKNSNPVIVNGKTYQPGDAITTLITDDKGQVSTENDLLPYGDYQIKETKAPEGYLPEGKNLVQDFSIRENGKIIELNTEDTAAQNQVIRGGVAIEKWDVELGEAIAQGAGSLKDAEFTITNQNEKPVFVNGQMYKKGEIVLVLKTDEKGKASTGKDVLPYGDYQIEETKAPEGYLPEGKNLKQTFTIQENEKLIQLNTQDTAAQNQIKRGDLELIKIEADTHDRMENVKFTITSKTTGESHPFITDENGYYSTHSSWVPHTQNTNRGESAEDGIWFGESKPNNEKGALPYDTYTIEEQPCEANKGHKLIKFDVVVKRDNVTINLGTLTDDLIPVVSIGTVAYAEVTEQKEIYATEDVTIIDEVSYINLTPNEEYTIKGVLMDKETAEKLLIDGKEVTAEKNFVAKKANGTVKMEFTLNAKELRGKEVVAFEKLYLGKQEIAAHEDIEDKDQTVSFIEPKISTEAINPTTGTQIAYATKQVKIVDMVSYSNLIPGMECTVKGVLMDQETNKPFLEDGKEVTAEQKFTAVAANGSVDMKFTFDASNLRGKKIVVFEKLFYKGKEIAAHEDINDKAQTIEFQSSEVITKAYDKSTNENKAYPVEQVTLVDEVSYKGLAEGENHMIRGTLMDKETGKAFMQNGKKVTVTKEFKPESTDGTVEVEFVLDATQLSGKQLVVFESILYEGKEVASHKDINDEEQTITFIQPKVKTEAEDKNTKTHEGKAEKSATIVDKVTLEGLIPGKEYTVQGVLMDQETKQPYISNGDKVTSEIIFTAEAESMEVSLEFVFDSSALDKKTVVVFETLIYEGKEIASHEDINDKAQSVTYKKKIGEITTSTGSKPSGSGSTFGSPKTGDANKIIPFVGLLVAALVFMGILIIKIKKEKHENKKM